MKARNWALVACLLSVACSPLRGCAESRFALGPESRLPRWFQQPPQSKREGLDVEMTYYVPLAGGAGTAIFVLSDQKGRKLEEVEATLRDDHPLTLSPAPG